MSAVLVCKEELSAAAVRRSRHDQQTETSVDRLRRTHPSARQHTHFISVENMYVLYKPRMTEIVKDLQKTSAGVKDKPKRNHRRAIAGAVISLVLVVLLGAVGAFLVCRNKKQRTEAKTDTINKVNTLTEEFREYVEILVSVMKFEVCARPNDIKELEDIISKLTPITTFDEIPEVTDLCKLALDIFNTVYALRQ